MSESIDQVKKRLRREAKATRAAAAAAVTDAASRVCRRLFEAIDSGTLDLPKGAPVSAYWPIGDEVDPRPIMARLVERGHPVGLPVMMEFGKPLVFRAWQPGQALTQAEFGLREPGRGAGEVVPQLLLVPLLAFDRAGYRLGYGGGFYDRTLALLAPDGARSVGLAYAGQELPDVPRDENDVPLDWLVTEEELLAIRGPVVESTA